MLQGRLEPQNLEVHKSNERMIEHEIDALLTVIRVASNRLNDATAPTDKLRAEDDLCVETRSLFTRYVDMVLWTGELQKSTHQRIRNGIACAAKAVGKRNTPAATSIRRRLVEFDEFTAEQRKRLAIAHA